MAKLYVFRVGYTVTVEADDREDGADRAFAQFIEDAPFYRDPMGFNVDLIEVEDVWGGTDNGEEG